MRRASAEGVILKISPLGESDLLMAILTPAMGPTRIVARRGLKSVKRFGGRLMLFNNLRFDYTRKIAGELAYMESASLIETFPSIYADPVSFGRASLFGEVTLAAWGEGDPAMDLYAFLVDYLERSEAGAVSPDRHLLDAFRLLSIIGHRPVLDSCACCGGELGDSRMYSVNEGGAVCGDCSRLESVKLAGRGTAPFAITRATARTVEEAFGQKRLLDRVKFSKRSRSQAADIWIKHVQALIGHTPRSIVFLEKLQRTSRV